MKILAIESSCDETAAAVVEDGRRVLSDAIASTSPTFISALSSASPTTPHIASAWRLDAISGTTPP